MKKANEYRESSRDYSEKGLEGQIKFSVFWALKVFLSRVSGCDRYDDDVGIAMF